MKTVGLIGARGHVGKELAAIVSRRDDLELVYASSRSLAGEPVASGGGTLRFEALSPEDAAAKAADAVVLALPNGQAPAWAEAIHAERPDAVIVDLSADFRFDDQWLYGLPEIYGRDQHPGAVRISNPGCYATAGQLCVAPVRERLARPANLFGVSGYSGAGTMPSRKNDSAALADNLMPYGLAGHAHEAEMSRHLGSEVRFSPHVAAFFRGLTVTAQLEFDTPVEREALIEAYRAFYDGEALIEVRDTTPEIRDGAFAPGAVIGGFALGEDGPRAVVVCALDNLLKGAAVQAVQNLALALGLPEQAGL